MSDSNSLSRTETIVIVLVIALWLISLIFPAFYTQIFIHDAGFPKEPVGRGGVWYGIYVLLIGWLGFFTFTISWYANPLLIISLVMFSARNKRTIMLASLTLFLAITSFLLIQIWNDGDPPEEVVKFGTGFYLWLLSIFILFIASILQRYKVI